MTRTRQNVIDEINVLMRELARDFDLGGYDEESIKRISEFDIEKGFNDNRSYSIKAYDIIKNLPKSVSTSEDDYVGVPYLEIFHEKDGEVYTHLYDWSGEHVANINVVHMSNDTQLARGLLDDICKALTIADNLALDMSELSINDLVDLIASVQGIFKNIERPSGDLWS